METIEEFGDGLMMVMNDYRIGLTKNDDDDETGTLWAIIFNAAFHAAVHVTQKIGCLRQRKNNALVFQLAAQAAPITQQRWAHKKAIGVILCKARYWLQRNQ